MITLYKGDDTGGQLGKNVKIAFHCDDAVDMDGVIVRFSLLDVITKEWTNVHDGDILELSVTHEQSGRLPLGSLFGKIWGEDPSGRVRTFANRLPIIVTNDLRKVYGSDGLDSQDIHVYSPVGWDAIANKPTLFPSKIELVEGLPEALDGVVKSVNGKTADASGAVTLTLDSFANKDGEIQVKQTLMVSRDGGQTFNAVATLVDVWDEIGSHNSSLLAHAQLFSTRVPVTRKVNGKQLNTDVVLKASDIDMDGEGTTSVNFAVLKAIEDAGNAATSAERAYTEAAEAKAGLAGKLDKTAVVAPSASATTGQAADAKAVGEALNGKLDNPSGDGNSLSFSAESMYFNNAYGVNYLYYPNYVGGDASKDAELKHDGFEIIATRFWVEWYLAQDTTKAALFAGADFRTAVVDEIKSRPYLEQGEGGGIYVVIPETK